MRTSCHRGGDRQVIDIASHSPAPGTAFGAGAPGKIVAGGKICRPLYRRL